jgi:hypothetical protein
VVAAAVSSSSITSRTFCDTTSATGAWRSTIWRARSFSTASALSTRAR